MDDYSKIKEILTWLIPLFILDTSISFVKVVFVKVQGSQFEKAIKFFASVLFGIVVGTIVKIVVSFNAALVLSPIATLLADQITNKIDKAGLALIWKYVKNKTNTDSDNTDNTTPKEDGNEQ